MIYIPLDIETSIHNNEVGKHKASPYSSKNFVVDVGHGVEVSEEKLEVVLDDGWREFTSWVNYEVHQCSNKVTIVGHNLTFDLSWHHYRLDEHSVLKNKDVYIWDTQQAEYLLSGQEHQFAKLDDLFTKYGIDNKDGDMKAYWDAGVSTEVIPTEIRHPYLTNDVSGTYLVMLHQMVEFNKNPKLFKLFKAKMRDLQLSICMEVNGMKFDTVRAGNEAYAMRGKITRATDDFEALVRRIYSIPAGIEVNINSNQQLGAILYGGTLPYTVDEPQLDEAGVAIKYKTGKKAGMVKTKKTVKDFPLAGFVKEPPELTAGGGIKVDTDVLEGLVLKYPALNILLDIRKMTKDYGTYFVGYAALTWPDGLIHPSIHHCSTDTGRTSSSSPNLQNVTRKEE